MTKPIRRDLLQDNFDGLLRLRDGWGKERKGKAPDVAGLAWLSAVLQSVWPDNPPITIFGELDGNVTASWGYGRNIASLKIDLRTHQGMWSLVSFIPLASFTRTLDLDQVANWTRIVNDLTHYYVLAHHG